MIEHQTATVSCDASGSPPPDVSWQRGGRLLPTYGSVRQSGNELHIDDVRVSDGGTYVCLAKNSAGTGVLGMRSLHKSARSGVHDGSPVQGGMIVYNRVYTHLLSQNDF